jgi:hypothetical protein
MAYTLTEAAKVTGLNKTTIFRAIRRGLISATKDATTGAWHVEPAELHRVYPAAGAIIASNGQIAAEAMPRNEAAEVEIRELRARLADAHDQIADLRQQRDREAEERRRLTALLADQRSAPPPAPGRSWWSWRRG